MYRYYKKGEINVMEYDFDSITEFIDYLDDTPINTNIWDCGNLASDTGSYDFCKTHSFQEAKDLCKFGLHDKFDKLVELKLTLEKYIKMSRKKNTQHNFYVGYTPDVKAYLEGNPLSMLNNQYPKRRHIDIYYNSAISWTVSTNIIFNRGAITLCLVEILENMGFSVGLNIFTLSECDGQVHYAKFNLKRNGERLNIQKLFFPLCNPSFLRRLVFRLYEETPDITRCWIDGYGKALDDYTIRKIIDLKDNDIVICKPDEMGVRGYDIIDDANAMFDYINKFTSKDVELEHAKRLRKL